MSSDLCTTRTNLVLPKSIGTITLDCPFPSISEYKRSGIKNNTLTYKFRPTYELEIRIPVLRPCNTCYKEEVIVATYNSEFILTGVSKLHNPSCLTLSVDGNTFLMTVSSSVVLSGPSIIYSITLFNYQGGQSLLTTASFLNPSEGVPLPNTGGQTIPNISGFVFATPDGKQISSVNYIVNKEEDCVLVTNTYIQYYQNIASVMKGHGCTIADKLAYLQTQGKAIDGTEFMIYSSHRLTLSQQLFGSYDVKFLKQNYYQRFLVKLKNGVEKSFFENSDYWTLFL
jgi:hypothetical protein